jgi:EmrB/QacA subfamily drug resistance transporter
MANIDLKLNKWLAFIGVALLSFGAYLDYTVVNVALPTIQQELQADLTTLQWVMNIYFLALCVFAIIMGRLGDLFGRRRCLYIGVAIFSIASIVAGCSPNVEWLIFGRLLQGVGAAIILPLGPSLLPHSFPVHERAKSIAWLGSVGGIALALGPVLGGVIVTYFSWRWIFFINIPIVILGYAFCMNNIKESRAKQQDALDWKGMVLLGLAISGIVLSLIHSQTAGWNSLVTLVYLFVGIISSILLFKVENKLAHPMIDFKDFAKPLFFSGGVLSFIVGVLSAVTLFFDPLYLQIIRGQSAQLSGFVLFAIPIAVFLVAFMVEGLIARIDIIKTILLALLIGLVSAMLHTFFHQATPLWYVIMTFILLGSVWAMGNTVPIIAAHAAVDSARMSSATGTLVTLFNIGGSIGLSIAVVIYNFVTAQSLKVVSANINLESSQNVYLEKLVSNPSHALEVSMGDTVHGIFNQVFISGFSGVMWFLVILSILLLVAVVVKNFFGRAISTD